MSDTYKLCYSSRNTQLAFKKSGANRYSLIYKKGTVSQNDADVYIDFDPKMWTCLAYGVNHDVRLSVKPSWQSSTSTISAMTTFHLPYATIVGGNTFTIALNALTHCDAEVYPVITAILVVQQANVGTFTKEIQLTVGVQSTATISASGGRITALN